jgi:hypothetical protein
VSDDNYITCTYLVTDWIIPHPGEVYLSERLFPSTASLCKAERTVRVPFYPVLKHLTAGSAPFPHVLDTKKSDLHCLFSTKPHQRVHHNQRRGCIIVQYGSTPGEHPKPDVAACFRILRGKIEIRRGATTARNGTSKTGWRRAYSKTGALPQREQPRMSGSRIPIPIARSISLLLLGSQHGATSTECSPAMCRAPRRGRVVDIQ